MVIADIRELNNWLNDQHNYQQQIIISDYPEQTKPEEKITKITLYIMDFIEITEDLANID